MRLGSNLRVPEHGAARHGYGAALGAALLIALTACTPASDGAGSGATAESSAVSSSVVASGATTVTPTRATAGNPTQSSAATTSHSATASATATSSTPSRGAVADSGIAYCDNDSLPPEVDDVIDDIVAGGPFDYLKDGTRFGNREGLLPGEPAGYYREYTVTTPGSRDRGARRIVTGGDPATDPEYFYYTGDHYGSFCTIPMTYS